MVSVERDLRIADVVDDHEVLLGIAQLLSEILCEMKHLGGTERTGAVSSVEVKYLAPTKDRPEGTPQPVIKIYAGSMPPVEEAIEAYGKTLLMMQQAALEGWGQTVEVLQAERIDRGRRDES